MRKKTHITVVLADPPNPKWNPYAVAFPNLGLLYLAAYLREHLSNVIIHYIDSSHSLCAHLERLVSIEPDLYGLSLSSPFATVGFRLIHEIKIRFPRLTIVCGGAHPSAAAEDVLANSEADVCCIGEGEETLVDIVRTLRNGGTLQGIAGTAYRNSCGGFVLSPPRFLISDLDDIPFPAWDLVRLEDYTGCRKAWGKQSTAIVASRGCLFNCFFCSNPVWRNQKPWLRLRSPDSIADEARLLYERGVREIYLRSDEMNPDHNWAIGVFDALAGLGLEDLHFQCNLRARPVSRALAAAIRRAGCWLCHLGLESSSERVLKGIRKGITSTDFTAAAQILKEVGIRVYAFVMLYQAWEEEGALQCESTNEVLATLRFVAKLRMKGLIDFMSWGFATPYPGSQLHEVSVRNNLRRDIETPHHVVTPLDITLQLPGVPDWHMALARTLGLSMQAALVLSAVDSYSLLTIRQNMNHALFKLRYILKLKTLL